MTDLPGYYFRIRENGALMFRLGEENRQRRVEMEQIAALNTRSGEIRGIGGRELSPEDRAAAEEWIAGRQALLAQREIDDIARLADQLNLGAQWALSRATPEQLDAVTEPLLMAMHDLRTVLVRKLAERAERPDTEA
ncbi:hypothetical protein [Limimaricola pyoseonensis]|uniref:Uncharacterized protein n=1 Tax=Limimaricola pyoseonensis TaxID=521013 RepID=A0A1G7D182_9RHOB|nr:hypothetical protein [Limimaricola pyoseonensis]SDE45287.1 hypothetical protein SAMN04488567_1738 [Limimaricola pyoseonensis]